MVCQTQAAEATCFEAELVKEETATVAAKAQAAKKEVQELMDEQKGFFGIKLW